jgi:kinesin family protein 3/17
VVVRCRPFSEKEKEAGHENIITINKEAASVEIKDPKYLSDNNNNNGFGNNNNNGDIEQTSKTFTFDNVFDEETTQMEIYNTTARPIVDSVLEGYNGTIFAYGQTGTGKTFSMVGDRDKKELRGIIPNAFDHIFSYIGRGGEDKKFLVRVSYLEIYNENIKDLLKPKSGKLEIKESPDIGLYVKDLSNFVVKDVQEMDRLMTVGNKNRSIGATQMNAHSSRSHSIFTITIEASEVDSDGQEHIRAGKLHLVDLAGSERQTKTGATGDRLKEATKINLSLSALGNVISALVDRKSSHIPYRDSKLTRLLQDSLGGNAKTVMIATLSPASYNYDESLSTLRYANRTKNIKNKPKVNEDPKDALLREFQEEIKKLKEQLEKMENGNEEANIIEDVEEIVEEEEEEEDDDEDDEANDQSNSQSGSKKAKKSSKKKKNGDKKGQKKVNFPISKLSEQKLKEIQEKVQAEKDRLLNDKNIIESEKVKYLSELEVRAKELEKERKARDQIEKKLAQMEAKLLVGGVNILDKNEEQQIILANQAKELEERRRQERLLQESIQNQEEAQFQIEENYNSLQEEVTEKTRKLKKLFSLMMTKKTEVKELREEYQQEREDLTDTIRELTRELKLKFLIVENYLPEEQLRWIEESAKYDESTDKWRILHIAHAGNNIHGKRGLLSNDPYSEAISMGNNKKNNNKINSLPKDAIWDPYCVFPDPYLVYDRKLSKNINKSRKGRPSSVKKTLMSGTSGLLYKKNIEGNNDSVDNAPKARGLVAKTKHYA